MSFSSGRTLSPRARPAIKLSALVSVCYQHPVVLPKPSISLTGPPTVLLPAPARVCGCGVIPYTKGVSAVGERTKLGLGIAGAAAMLGFLGDGLLRATPWGLNVFLSTVSLVGLAVSLASWRGIPVTR